MSQYCVKCGNKLEEDSKFCSKCGTKDVDSEVVVNNQNIYQNQIESKTNGQAIASFVVSLVGLIIFGLICGIVSISLATAALNSIKSNPNEKGKGLAIAGLVIGIIDCVLIGFGTIANIIAAIA